MKSILALALLALVAAPVQQQEDWLDEMKKMDEMVTKIQGPTYLLRALRLEMQRACKALDDSRLDLADRHLLRLAHVSRPYNFDHATRVVGIAHALRTEIRQEGVTRVKAVAEFLKAGKAKEAAELVDDTLNTPYLATTYRAEFERLKEWLKKPPDPATVEAELARWRAMMPPGSLNSCESCKGTGEAACGACAMGSVEQECRSCKATGQGPCGMCSGKGKVAHGGFGGDLYLVIAKDFKVPQVDDQGRPTGRNYIYPAQKIQWTIKPCGGKNSVHVHGRSDPFDPKKEKKDEQIAYTCAKFFDQLRTYVFTGSAKLYSGPDTKKNGLTVEQVKMMFAEYETCGSGRVACDACEGKGIGKCGPCGAKGRRLGLCSTCWGAGAEPCPVCKASGDSTWLGEKIPATRVPALGACMNKHVKALNAWQNRRASAIARRENVRVHLAEAKKGLDPTAKLTADSVNVACSKCAGKGGKCEPCWGAGRREFFAGTPEFDKYDKARKLQEQLAALSKGSLGVSSASIQLEIEDNSIEPWKAPPPSDAEPPKPAPPPGVGSGIGGEIAELPAELQESIRKANDLFEEGKKAYELASNAGDDNEKRSAEANRSKKALKEAMEIYSNVLQTLDERGINTPKALNEKVNLCQQALKLARNMAF